MKMNEQYQIQEYTQTAAALAILREKYNGPFDVATTKGMTVAKEARAEVRGYRVALEKLRVELKAPALERTRLIDAEAKRITAELLQIEEPIDQAIKAEEQRKEEEKAAKARAEAARLAGMAAKISAIRQRMSLTVNKTSDQMKIILDEAQALELSPDEFQEFLPDALQALKETQNAIQAALDYAILYEAEQARIKAEQAAEAARLKAEREELERLRAAETARQAEAVRIAEEARKVEEARLQAEREAQAAALKAQREEQERQEREARQVREAEEARLQAERQAMEQERQALEARQRQMDENERKVKAIKTRTKGQAVDPLADLKQALAADDKTAQALDEAYQRGFHAGLKCAPQAA
jgi:hypothetical protein